VAIKSDLLPEACSRRTVVRVPSSSDKSFLNSEASLVLAPSKSMVIVAANEKRSAKVNARQRPPGTTRRSAAVVDRAPPGKLL